MRALRTALGVFVVLGLVPPALAKDCETLVTPYRKTITRTTGAPNQSDDTVSVPTTRGSWWLTVESQGVTAAWVSVNGSQVFGPSDFKKSVSLLRAPVTVTATTAISVRLAGKPGEQLALRLDGVVPDSAVPANTVQHVFQRTFFTQGFSGAGSATITLPSASGLFWLDVQNGTAQGTNRASSASVTLNGVPVFGPNDFSQQVGALEAPVLVQLSNVLDVSLNAPPNATVVVSLRGFAVDTEPPRLSIDEPKDGVWHRLAGSMRISFSDAISGIDPASLRVSINGADVTSRFVTTASMASAALTSLYPPLHEGANAVTASIADQACNVTTTQIDALIDSRPPLIAVSPGDGSFTSLRPSFTVTLTDPMPGSGVAVNTFKAFLDGADVSPFFIFNGLTGTTRFTSLATGKHTFLFTVQDVAGNEGQLTSHFTVSPPPTLSIVPADGSATNDTLPGIIVTHIAGEGTTIDLSSVQLMLDSAALSPVAQVASQSGFLPAAPLAEGTHRIHVSVADAFGQTSTLDSSFRVELTATHLGVTIAPSDPASVLVFSLNSITIAALTSSNLVAKGVTGPIQITTTNGLATLDQLFATMTPADQGVLTIPRLAIVRQPGPLTVTAVALASPTITGALELTGVTQVPSFVALPDPSSGKMFVTIATVPNATVTVFVDGQPIATLTADRFGVPLNGIPRSLFNKLLCAGLVEVSTPTGFDMPQTRFRPGAYPAVNAAAKWQVLRLP